MGQFMVTLQYKDRSSQQTIFVIKGLKTNLLGLPAITALNLAARIDTITDYQAIIEEIFPTLFQGLGNLGEHMHYMCLPLRDKVRDELNRMESIGVISRIE